MLFVFHSQSECRLTIYLFLAFYTSLTLTLSLAGHHPITATVLPIPGRLLRLRQWLRSGAVQFGPRPDTWPASVTVFGESRNGIDCADAASVVVVVCEVWQRLMYSASEHKTQDTLVCSFVYVCVCISIYGRCLKQIKFCSKPPPAPRLLLLPLPGTRKKPYAVDEKGGRQEDIGNERTNTHTHREMCRQRQTGFKCARSGVWGQGRCGKSSWQVQNNGANLIHIT